MVPSGPARPNNSPRTTTQATPMMQPNANVKNWLELMALASCPVSPAAPAPVVIVPPFEAVRRLKRNRRSGLQRQPRWSVSRSTWQDFKHIAQFQQEKYHILRIAIEAVSFALSIDISDTINC